MGAPFDTGTWEGVVDAYYAGAGSETVWLVASIALCVVALIGGAIHESRSYRKAEQQHRDV